MFLISGYIGDFPGLGGQGISGREALILKRKETAMAGWSLVLVPIRSVSSFPTLPLYHGGRARVLPLVQHGILITSNGFASRSGWCVVDTRFPGLFDHISASSISSGLAGLAKHLGARSWRVACVCCGMVLCVLKPCLVVPTDRIDVNVKI